MQLLHKTYWLLSLILFTTACTKDYKNYEQFIKDGPIVYPGRADTVQALAGKERILLKWAVPSDLNITNYKIYWNFGGDSLDIQGRKPVAGDSIKIYINNLVQGSYNFTVYSFDGAGHRSIGSNTIGNVYGSIFSSSILTRSVLGQTKDVARSILRIGWVDREEKCIGTEWAFTNANGASASLFSPLADSTIITAINVTQPISYRSLYLPEANAIDTFFTEFKSL
jgi:hypothetical protein